MSNPIISKQQMLRLLTKLATEDVFRARYERDPKAAMIECGFDATELESYPSELLAPNKLGSKEMFEAARIRVQTDIVEHCECMIIPGPIIASRQNGFVERNKKLARAA